jgi:PAS domain-containing protein
MKKHHFFLPQLCRLIEQKANRKINGFPDTIWLSEEFKKENLFISGHTLARVFGIIPNTSKPYKSTLDCLALFMHYESWDHFIKMQMVNATEKNYFLTENSTGFSELLLKKALEDQNYTMIKQQLNAYNSNESYAFHFRIANLIGQYVQKNFTDQTLLKLLAQTQAGQSLFYGCFVDEVNEQEYFSKALINLYLPQINTIECGFYCNAYALAQAHYKGLPTIDYLNLFKHYQTQMNFESAHYHLISRNLECMVLMLDTKENQPYCTLLDLTVEALKGQNKAEWILARVIRAMLHQNRGALLAKHSKFNEAIKKILFKNQAQKLSSALNIIQFYWLHLPLRNLKKDPFLPMTFEQDYLKNNIPEQMGIEMGIALQFASAINKSFLLDALEKHCRTYKLNWILNGVQNH